MSRHPGQVEHIELPGEPGGGFVTGVVEVQPVDFLSVPHLSKEGIGRAGRQRKQVLALPGSIYQNLEQGHRTGTERHLTGIAVLRLVQFDVAGTQVDPSSNEAEDLALPHRCLQSDQESVGKLLHLAGRRYPS